MTDTIVSADLLNRLGRTEGEPFTQAELESLRPRIDEWLAATSRTDVTANMLIERPGSFPITWATFADYLREQAPQPRFLLVTEDGRDGVRDSVTGWTAWGLYDRDATDLNDNVEGAFNWTWTDPEDRNHEAFGDGYRPIVAAAREVATRPYDYDTALSHPEDTTALAPLLPAYTIWMRNERGRDEDTTTVTWQSVVASPSRYTTHLSLFRNWLGDHPEHVPTVNDTTAPTQAESKPLTKWQELGFVSEEAYATFSRKVAETANRLRKCEEADAFVTELGLIPRQEMTRRQTVKVAAFEVTVEVPFTAGAVHFASNTAEIDLRIREAINRHVTEQVLRLRQYTVTDPEFVAPRY